MIKRKGMTIVSISAVSSSSDYYSNQQKISDLEDQEKNLQDELSKLEKSSSDKSSQSSQSEQNTIEQEIQLMNLQIQQAEQAQQSENYGTQSLSTESANILQMQNSVSSNLLDVKA
jgi:septal ring factor EnvC (AmiA/AmiB activator)